MTMKALCRGGLQREGGQRRVGRRQGDRLIEGVELAPVLFDATGGGEGMKYVLLFCGSAEDAAAFEALTPDDLRARYAQVGAWFAEHRSKSAGATSCRGWRRPPRCGSGRTGRRW
jgi:hypothetical protein